ncbi:helix-turn-helix transcriptional regulator [Paenibacillus sp. IB182496]|uniref:Helix-turn-helix transcriptional regulator n=1 Tax=Paenibacillus sabuli TaxID=2772509 RepID=A0A927BRA3_9BACL|nr:helix-turn-helix domain-containing protein [Paenibacillus sabuli]MBD2844310.1 helix-turn-helix transcriptional regulator [Paenibacillus sabuli]
MIKQRRLLDQSQVFEVLFDEPPVFMITPQQSQQFYNYFLAADVQETLHWIQKKFKQLHDRDAYAYHHYQLCEEIINQTQKSLHSLQIPEEALDPLPVHSHYCATYTSLVEWTEEYVQMALNAVQAKKNLTDSTMAFIVNYMEQHYADDLSLDLLASKLKITSSYLSGLFKNKIGVNFKQYLNAIRMKQAEHLLLHTNLKIQDIADQVGYRSLTPFMRMFKKTTGHTPSEYRRSHAE